LLRLPRLYSVFENWIEPIQAIVLAMQGYRSAAPAVDAVRALRMLAGASAVALVLAGCSMSFPLPSLVAHDEVTGAIGEAAGSPLSRDLGAEDWRRAKAALATALDPQGSGAQVAWDNPDTRIKGSFTPVGSPFVKSDEICRAFLATIVGQVATASLQGSACRPSGGEWSVKDVKPWRKPG
jgi:surface antigen